MDENNSLANDVKDFFTDDVTTTSDATIGRLGVGLLHLVALFFGLYSLYHGLHATASYRAAAGLGMAAGAVGIAVNELVLAGLYIAYFHGMIIGDFQKIAAAFTAGLGFIICSLGIVGDSLIQAGLELPSWLSLYMRFGLPNSPAIMALGAVIVLAAHPAVARRIKAALKRESFLEKKHTRQMQAQDARLGAVTSLANVQLNALTMAGRYAADAYRTIDVQAYIQQAAIDNLPDILRGAGVFIPYGTVIEGATINPPAVPPPQADPPPAADEPATAPRSGLGQRLRNRLAGRQATEQPQPAQPADPPADDAARHVLGDLTPAELRQLLDDLAVLRQAQAAAPSGAGGNNGIHPNA